MTVLNLQVGASGDDGYTGTFGFSAASGCYVSSSGGGPTNSFGRFTNVTVPNAATISSADASFTRYSADTGTIDYIIEAYDEDNAAAPTSAGDHNGRARTTANTTGSVSGGAAESTWTVSITSVVQELVNRSGWASGNAQVIVWNHGGVNAFTTLLGYGYDLGTSKAPKLDITYSAGGATYRRLLLLGCGA
jgi:hypothetical protein